MTARARHAAKAAGWLAVVGGCIAVVWLMTRRDWQTLPNWLAGSMCCLHPIPFSLAVIASVKCFYHLEALNRVGAARAAITPTAFMAQIQASVPVVLYLRNFSFERGTAGITSQPERPDGLGRSPFIVQHPVVRNLFELSIAEQVTPFARPFALSNDGSDTYPEMDHVLCPNEQWWDMFTRASKAARGIILVCSRLRPGLQAELSWLAEQELGHKCVLIEIDGSAGDIEAVSRFPWHVHLKEGSISIRSQSVVLPDGYLAMLRTGNTAP